MRAPAAQRRPARGAATVEFALSLLLLVPAVFYALYAGEAFMVGIKAQEAEINAAFDVTPYHLHDFIDGDEDRVSDLYQNALFRAEQRVGNELQGLDSYRATGTGIRYAVTEGQLDSLVCTRVNPAGVKLYDTFDYMRTDDPPPSGGPASRPRIPSNPGSGVTPTTPTRYVIPTRNYLQQRGFIQCNAQVSLRNHGMPTGFFLALAQEPMLRPAAAAFSMCGLGGTLQGCETAPGDGPSRGLMLLTDDWGMEDGGDNHLGTRENARYFDLAESIFASPGRTWDAAGIGTEQVSELMDFLTGKPADMGETTDMKLGYTTPISVSRLIPSGDPDDAPVERAHLTPWDDGEGAIVDGSVVYGQRRNGHYLGHPQANFNDP